MFKKKWVAAALVVGVVGCWSLLAVAGSKESREVSVTADGASGSLGSARASGDANQYIGCQTYGSYGWCGAADSAGNSKSCFYSTPDKAAAAQSIGPQSHIWFQVASDGFTCEYLAVSNYSMNLTVTP